MQNNNPLPLPGKPYINDYTKHDVSFEDWCYWVDQYLQDYYGIGTIDITDSFILLADYTTGYSVGTTASGLAEKYGLDDLENTWEYLEEESEGPL